MTLPLETWRETIGFNPYHFWGLANSSVPITSDCNSLVGENAWQNASADRMGREQIRQAIATAEARMREYLGYRIGAEYVEKELIYPRPNDARMEAWWNADASGRIISVNLREGFIRALGTEAFETLDIDAAVVYTDANGDGVTDTATLTIADVSSSLDVSQVVCYFADADRPDGSTGTNKRKWRIEPIEASLSGTTLTIKIRSWLLVRPIKYAGVTVAKIDPDETTAANFAQTLQVYRSYTQTEGTTTATAQAVLLWEANPPEWACTSSSDPALSSDPAAVGMAVARCGIRNARLGEVIPGEATYNSDTGVWTGVNWNTWRQPDRVKVRYLAGAQRHELDSQVPESGNWDVIIARLATAELARRICGCDGSNANIDEWQTDLARIEGNATALFRITDRDLQNPLGTRRGHLYAWNQIKNLAVTRAFVI